MQRPGSVGRCFFLFLMMFCRRRRCVGRTLCDLHISQELSFTFHNFNFHHADPELTRRVSRIFPSLVETGSGGTITSMSASVGLSKCSVVVVTSLPSTRICSSLPTRTGIGRLALLPYALAVITRSNFFGSGCLYSIFTSSPSCALDQRPHDFGREIPCKLFHLFWRTGDVEDETVGLKRISLSTIFSVSTLPL